MSIQPKEAWLQKIGAIATVSGWEHPKTGELLKAQRGLLSTPESDATLVVQVVESQENTTAEVSTDTSDEKESDVEEKSTSTTDEKSDSVSAEKSTDESTVSTETVEPKAKVSKSKKV